MRLQLTLLLATCWFAHLAAQTSDELNALTHRLSIEKKFDELTALSSQADRMGDSSLYRLGRAFFYLGNYPECQKYLTLVLQKNPRYANAWYFRSASHLLTEEYPQALSDANEGARLAPTDPDMHLLKGDIFSEQWRLDSALTCYVFAQSLPDCPLQAWTKAADKYRQSGDFERGLQVNRDLLPIAETRRDTEVITDCLLMIGVTDMQQNQPKKAEKSFRRILELDPTDYTVTQNLIHVLYAQKQYKKAQPYREVLYAAWKADKLPKHLEDYFLFDEFEWEGKKIIVIENFSEEGSLYYKHIFNVMNEKGSTEFTIQTESSAAIVAAGHKYTLGRTTATKHYTYIQFLFKKDFDYDDVKKAVIRILEGKEEPSSSSNLRKH